MASIKEIAAAANVSTATVSRVFSRQDNVKPETVARVLAAANSLDYSPKFNAAGGNFGLVVMNKREYWRYSYRNMMVGSVIQAFAQKGEQVEVIDQHDLPFLHKKSYRCLLFLESFDHQANLPFPKERTLYINQVSSRYHSVCTDHAQGTAIGLDHLLSMGHEKIGLITWNSDNWSNRERISSWQAYVDTAPDMTAADFIVRIGQRKEIMEALVRLMRKGATAIIGGCEEFSLPICNAAYMVEKAIPEDISVIGFEVPGITEYSAPPLTTISQNFPGLAEKVAEVALEIDAANGHMPLKHVLLENELIIRDSVKRL